MPGLVVWLAGEGPQAEAELPLGAAWRVRLDDALLDSLRPYAWGAPQTIGMLSLTRHGGFDATYDKLIPRLRDWDTGRTGYAKASVDEIIANENAL